MYIWSNNGNVAPSVDGEVTGAANGFLLHAQHSFQLGPSFALVHVVSLILVGAGCSEGCTLVGLFLLMCPVSPQLQQVNCF